MFMILSFSFMNMICPSTYADFFKPAGKILYCFLYTVLYYLVNLIKDLITLYLLFYILLLKSFTDLEIQTTPKASDNSAHGLGIRKNRGQDIRKELSRYHSCLQ